MPFVWFVFWDKAPHQPTLVLIYLFRNKFKNVLRTFVCAWNTFVRLRRCSVDTQQKIVFVVNSFWKQWPNRPAAAPISGCIINIVNNGIIIDTYRKYLISTIVHNLNLCRANLIYVCYVCNIILKCIFFVLSFMYLYVGTYLFKSVMYICVYACKIFFRKDSST